MPSTENTFTKKPLKWYDHIATLCHEASMTSFVGRLRIAAPTVFRRMVNDIDHPIAPEVEAEIARYLRLPYQDELKPSETLLPRMMEKYGITSEQFSALEKKHSALLNQRCNQCTVVSQCWKAMRDNAELEECERFCPNQANLDSISH